MHESASVFGRFTEYILIFLLLLDSINLFLYSDIPNDLSIDRIRYHQINPQMTHLITTGNLFTFVTVYLLTMT